MDKINIGKLKNGLVVTDDNSQIATGKNNNATITNQTTSATAKFKSCSLFWAIACLCKLGMDIQK